jgi:hypothetical protein
MVHTFNPRHLGGRGRRIKVLHQTGQNANLPENQTKNKRIWGMDQVVEFFVPESLGVKPYYHQKKKKKRRIRA